MNFILENISPAAIAAIEKLLEDYFKSFLSPTTINETTEKDQMESLTKSSEATNINESLTSSSSKGAYPFVIVLQLERLRIITLQYQQGLSVFIL